MSDSYAISRTRAEAKRKPPPKKPRRVPIVPIWAGAVILVHAGVGYAVASREVNLVEMVAHAVVGLIYLDDLWLRWQWRRWTEWTGQQKPPVDFAYGMFRGIVIANAAWLVGKFVAKLLGLL